MGTPSNPGWTTGYVPSAAEWDSTWSGKVDFPASVDQGGTGGRTGAAASYNILQRGLLIASTQLQPVTRYGVKTGLGAMSFVVPASYSLSPGDWIDLADVDFYAATNHVTLTATGVDVIWSYGTSASSQTLSVSGFRITLIANTNGWVMV